MQNKFTFVAQFCTMTNLRSRVIKTEPANWRKFQFIQQDDFKALDDEAMSKPKQSILSDSFIQPFYVWLDNEGAMYCLDGKHRTIALEELNGEGFIVPELLPTTFVECENKQEAAKLVLKYSSIYAKITQQGLYDFLQMYELEFEEIRDQIDLPELSETRFEQKFDLYDIENSEEPEVIVEEAIVRYINYCNKRNLSIKFTHLNGNIKLDDFYGKHNLSANEKCIN